MGVKLSYKQEATGWYVPYYQNDEMDKPEPLRVRHLGHHSTELHKLAYNLGKNTRWEKVYHYTPAKKQTKEEQALIFETEMKVHAFLAGVRFYVSQNLKPFDDVTYERQS